MAEETKRPRYAADFNIQITVYFNDDGSGATIDQAYNAAEAFVPGDTDDMQHFGLEIIGNPRLAQGPRP